MDTPFALHFVESVILTLATVSWGTISLYKLLSEWQTLIGSLLALAAAAFALIPVWRQLNRMELQTEAMLREPHVARIRDAEWSLGNMNLPLLTFLRESGRDLNDFYEEQEPSIDDQAAFHWAGILSDAARAFKALSDSRLDIEPIEAAKVAVIAAAEKLETALDDMTVPERMDREDVNATETEWAEVVKRSEDAERSVPGLCSGLWVALQHLNTQREMELNTLRLRLRAIDDRLANG